MSYDNPTPPPDPYGQSGQNPQGQPGQNPQGQPGHNPYGSQQGVQQAGKGFFGALFDFSFNHFITPIIVKVVYVLALVALVASWFFFMIAMFTESAVAGLGVLILGPIGIILYLAFIRMTLEFYLAIVRMSEDIRHRLPRA